jgi:CubicO group peptidase (beta-lactamase class C family)
VREEEHPHEGQRHGERHREQALYGVAMFVFRTIATPNRSTVVATRPTKSTRGRKYLCLLASGGRSCLRSLVMRATLMAIVIASAGLASAGWSLFADFAPAPPHRTTSTDAAASPPDRGEPASRVSSRAPSASTALVAKQDTDATARAPQPDAPSPTAQPSATRTAATIAAPTPVPLPDAPSPTATPSAARTAATTSAPAAPILPALDAAMIGVLAQGYPGGSLAVLRDGRLVYARGYGFANAATPATAETRYRQASISKPVTRSLLARLVASGTISLDTRVYEFLGVTPSDARANAITVRMLRDHTSGLAADHFASDSRDAAAFYGVASPPDADTMVRWTARQMLAAEPGAAYKYNNTDYALLTRVIERATGRAWMDLLHEMVRPLGVTSWRVGPSLVRPADEARYWEAERWRYASSVFDSVPGIIETPYGGYDAAVLGGATALVSTVVDMARYGHGISVGTIPAPETSPIPTRPGWNYTYVYNGSMPGHYTFVIRIWDGTHLTILAGAFNHRDAGPIDGTINRRMLDAYAATPTWPAVDLLAGR